MSNERNIFAIIFREDSLQNIDSFFTAMLGVVSLILCIFLFIKMQENKKMISNLITENFYTCILTLNNYLTTLKRPVAFLKMNNDGENPCDFEEDIIIDTMYLSNISDIRLKKETRK